MGDATARALKAPSPMVVKFGDKECQVRPLGVQELTEAERECLKNYRRNYLETWVENADLLENSEGMLQEKMELAARWDVDDLPKKTAYDPVSVEITERLKSFVGNYLSLELKSLSDKRTKQLTAGLLDQGSLTIQEYKELTDKNIRSVKIPYVNWWVTGSFDGMSTFIWLCFRKYGVMKEEVLSKISKEPALLIELSREIERLSTPAVENG